MRSRCINILAVLFFFLGFSSVAYSGELEDGKAAYQRGEFTKESAKWFRKAAEWGHASMQRMLGVMYYKGEGVLWDYKEAVKWYRKAAEQGDAEAQNNFGGMYYDGKGVPQDYVLAYMWLNLAVYNGFYGNVALTENRDAMRTQMTPGQIEKAQTLTREWLEKKGK